MEEKKSGNRLEAFKPNFTDSALGFYHDPKDNQWKLVSIEFDPALKVAGKVQVTHAEGDRHSIVERFKIQAAMDLNVG